jgi:hypothetical protein
MMVKFWHRCREHAKNMQICDNSANRNVLFSKFKTKDLNLSIILDIT